MKEDLGKDGEVIDMEEMDKEMEEIQLGLDTSLVHLATQSLPDPNHEPPTRPPPQSPTQRMPQIMQHILPALAST